MALSVSTRSPRQDFLSIADLSKVFKEVHAARSKWFNIGFQLDMIPSDLNVIKERCQDDIDDCFRELLSAWLGRVYPRPTWAKLVSALKSPTVGYARLAESVEEKHILSTVEEQQSADTIIGDLVMFSKEFIGQGAFGMVFKGQWQRIPCAAKMLTPLGQEIFTGIPITQWGMPVQKKALSSFNKECQLMKTLHHPNIVTYYDTLFHPQSNLPVLVMELMNTSLCHYLKDQGSISERVQVNLCHNIASALEFLHSKNIIHRDLCGENILLKYTDGEDIPVAKLTDFGISRKNVDMTHSLTALGHRPGYLPPEAPEDPADYDSSLDIFMFGAVMTQIAMNCPAIKSMAGRQKLVKGLREIGHILSPLIGRCLDEEKKKRPTAHVLCVRLQHLLDSIHHDVYYVH